jgi:hypothetical protein
MHRLLLGVNMGIVWEGGITPDVMIERLSMAYVASIRAGLVAIARNRAPQIEYYMKANHPWRNRTGEAESTLSVTVDEVERELIEILLAHGVEYGFYLEGFDPRGGTLREMMRGGLYAILTPSVDAWGPVIMQDIRIMLGA